MATSDVTGVTLIIVDVKNLGEPITNPNVRVCPLQEKKYQQMAAAVLEARKPEPGTSHPGELVLVLDGGKWGNMKILTKPWSSADLDAEAVAEEDDIGSSHTSKSTCHRVIQVLKSQKSVMGRRPFGKARGPALVQQIENLHLIGPASLLGELPEREWGDYVGTHFGTAIGPVDLLCVADDWCETRKKKRETYGKQHCIAVGGPDGVGLQKSRCTDGVGLPPCFASHFLQVSCAWLLCKNVIRLSESQVH